MSGRRKAPIAPQPSHEDRSPKEHDQEAQAIVLELVLTEHPAQLTVAEITLALALDSSFAERDRIEQAVRELERAGLVRRQLESVIPTRPALRLRELVAYWP